MSHDFVEYLEAALKHGHVPENLTSAVSDAIRTCHAHQRQDRSALLRMAGNIAPGIVVSACQEQGGISLERGVLAAPDVARLSVAIARAILEEVDRGEQ